MITQATQNTALSNLEFTPPANVAALQGDAHKHLVIDLSDDDIKHILALQDKEQSGNTIKRDEQYLTRHFENGHSGLGIIHDGKLIAQALISTSLVKGEDLKAHFKEADESKVYRQSTIGTFIVDPAYRGQGLSDQLLDQWEAHAKDHGATIMHARVKQENVQGHIKFSGLGMTLSDIAGSPEDPSRIVSYFYKPV